VPRAPRLSKPGPPSSRQSPAHRPAHRPKQLTADCKNCLLLNSLRGFGLPATTIQAICERMWLNRVRRGQVLYTEGNGATHLYAIRSGRVKLVKVNASGRAHVTSHLRSGDLFGFEALFDQTYATGAETVTDCDLCLASADHLQGLMEQFPRVATDLARYLHVQLSRARERQVAATTPGASARVAAYLIHSLASNGSGEGRRIAARDLTLKELGGILGLAPETICRVLADLRSRGIVESIPSGVLVKDVDTLRQISGL
jgi:CRP-like cAMP-binding protein